jgi:hypothetical protein
MTEKWLLLPAVHFTCSVQYEATFSTITERTEADIFCSMKCWILNVMHNKLIPLHIYLVTPYGTSVLSPADPNHHQVKVNLFSPLLSCSSVNAYNLTSHFTDGIWKSYFWFFCCKVLSVFRIFNLPHLNLSVLFFPFISEKLQLKKYFNKYLYWFYFKIFWNIFHSKNNSASYYPILFKPILQSRF